MAEDRGKPAELEEEAPFDANPPVDPTQPQVGNSKAQFFLPSEDERQDEAREDGDEGREEKHGESPEEAD